MTIQPRSSSAINDKQSAVYSQLTRESGPCPRTVSPLFNSPSIASVYLDIWKRYGADPRAYVPRGGLSDLCTMTMPLRIADRLTRFKARETHCPASADVTAALYDQGILDLSPRGTLQYPTACAVSS